MNRYLKKKSFKIKNFPNLLISSKENILKDYLCSTFQNISSIFFFHSMASNVFVEKKSVHRFFNPKKLIFFFKSETNLNFIKHLHVNRPYNFFEDFNISVFKNEWTDFS